MKSILLFAFFALAYCNVAYAQFLDKVSLNGYSSFEFEYLISDEGKGDPNASFDADLFDLVFNIDMSEKVRVAADISWEHGTATEEDFGNVAIEYAFPELTVTDALKIRVGKMFVPFGIYNEIHTAKPAFLAVKEPLSTNKPHKFGSDERFYPRWAVGVSVLGNFTLGKTKLDYHLQLSNGSQENTNPFEEDDNKQKAVAARVRAMPLKGLKVGFSTYSDRLTELDTLGNDSGNRTKVFSFSTHAEYELKGFGTEFEYIVGSTDPSDATTTLNKNALEAMISYTIKDKITPYFRYEHLDPDTDAENDIANMISFGINAMITEGYILKLQFNSISSEDANDRFSGKDFTEIQAAVVIGF